MHHCITIVGHIKRGKLRSRRLSLCSQVPKCTKAMPYPIVYIVSNLPKMCNLTSSDKVFAQLNKYPFAIYVLYLVHEYYLLIISIAQKIHLFSLRALCHPRIRKTSRQFQFISSTPYLKHNTVAANWVYLKDKFVCLTNTKTN